MERSEMHVDCPICDGKETITIRIKFIRDHADLNIRRCKECGYELTDDDLQKLFTE